MEMTGHNTYYFNSQEGVTPANHNVKYDYDKAVSDTFYGDYDMAEARLEIENRESQIPKRVPREYRRSLC